MLFKKRLLQKSHCLQDWDCVFASEGMSVQPSLSGCRTIYAKGGSEALS